MTWKYEHALSLHQLVTKQLSLDRGDSSLVCPLRLRRRSHQQHTLFSFSSTPKQADHRHPAVGVPSKTFLQLTPALSLCLAHNYPLQPYCSASCRHSHCLLLLLTTRCQSWDVSWCSSATASIKSSFSPPLPLATS